MRCWLILDNCVLTTLLIVGALFLIIYIVQYFRRQVSFEIAFHEFLEDSAAFLQELPRITSELAALGVPLDSSQISLLFRRARGIVEHLKNEAIPTHQNTGANFSYPRSYVTLMLKVVYLELENVCHIIMEDPASCLLALATAERLYQKMTGREWGSVDAIRLLLRHKNVPHAEFYADRSFGCEEIRSRFEAAGLPATLPYFSDNHCEMTGSRTILIYLAKQLKLYGTSRADAIHIESIVDYCFAALHTIWGAECKCAYPQELNRERARAHYCRDEVLPMLQTMCRLVSQAATREEAHDVFQSGGRQQGMRNKRLAQWIVGERIWGFNDPALFATAGLHGTGRGVQ
ncbi:glutathione s-transferase [Cyclospora cayetanensis]|uniref:Glutathione s-transferase n=1 Tax=Cyclospora cayetanensis TaxID=88456 RepID=A0A1D3D5L6_9EIME|nr:glutathione s-transferase [Cyclospora cayetanensis]